MLKKLIALSLSMTMTLCAAIPISYAEEAVQSKFDAELLLKKLDIVEPDAQTDKDKIITRISFLELVLNAAKINIPAAAEKIFYDVDTDSNGARYVTAAYNRGIITGYADGRFCPDDSITLAEAYIIAVRALGGGDISSFMGGYLSGYSKVAQRIGLTDKLGLALDGELNYAAACILIFNMLNADRLEYNMQGELIINNNETLLSSDLYNILRYEGIVDADSIASLYGGGKAHSGEINIDGNAYKAASEYDGRFVGRRVEYFVRTDRSTDTEEIVYIYEKNSKSQIIDAFDIISVYPTLAKYYDEGGKVRELDISGKAIMLKNGVKATIPATGIGDIKYGSFEFIDNDNDRKIDVILYSNAVLGIVSSVTEDSLYASNNVSFKIDFEDYERIDIRNEQGEEYSSKDIVKNNLIEVYYPGDNEYLKIIVCTNTVAIDIGGFEVSENDSSAYNISSADGGEYQTIRDFANFHINNRNGTGASKLQIGGFYAFAVDSHGRLAAIVEDGATNNKYGYLIRTLDETSDEATPGVMLKILTSDGITENIPLADKVKEIKSGTRYREQGIPSILTTNQVVKYKLNKNGEINAIEPARTDNPSAEDFRISGKTPNKTNYMSRYYTSSNLMGASIAVGKQTVIFHIPTDADDEEGYRVSLMDGLKNQKYYKNAVGYTDGNSIYSTAVVVENVESISKSSSRMLLSKVGRFVWDNELGEDKQIICGYVDGELREYTLKDNSVLSNATLNEAPVALEEGDIIRIELNSKGELSAIDVVYDRSSSTLATEYEGEDYGDELVYVKGQVSKKGEKYIQLKDKVFNIDGDGNDYPAFYAVTSSTYIYEYDSEMATGNRTKVSTLDDIIPLEQNPSMSDYAILVTTYSTVPMIVIYK